MTMTSESVRLVELTGAVDGLTVGRKAEGLMAMVLAGLPVPPGVVVPAETGDDDIECLASEIAGRFTDRRLSVRSSGVAEDLGGASYAGQYLTLLDVEASPTAVAAAIRAVRASAGDAHVASYTGSRSTAMAVLVMPMVAADAAGVAFTRDPVSGRRVVVVEAVRGLGHHLASGEATGERWLVDTDVEGPGRPEVLDADGARAIADLARRCEEAAGSPQDIEWATEGGDLVLLQSRPITATDDVEPIPMDEPVPPGPWEWDSTHNRLPITPLTGSTFAPGFASASRRMVETYGVPASHLEMRAINGYLYIQVVPPLGKPGQPNPPTVVMRAMFHLIPLLRKRRRAARRALSERIDRRLRDEWTSTVGPATEATLDRWYDVSLSELSNDELSVMFLDAVAFQRSTFEWNMITDPAYLLPLAELHDFVGSTFGRGMETTTRLLAGASPSAYLASALRFSEALPPDVRAAIVAGGGVEALDETSAGRYEAHLRSHGQKILGFDLSHETHLEDADRELARIATMRTPADPSVEAAALASRLRAGLDPADVEQFDELLREAREAYPIREAGEAVHARAMGMVRLIALEAGDRMVAAGHLADRAHVVFVELDELVAWLREPYDVADRVRIRRGQDRWARGRSPEPYLGPEVPMPPLEAFHPDIRPVMRLFELISTHDMRPPDLADGADGVAASPGVFTGPVRLVEDAADFERVQDGDVLVAPITTSPWEVLFPHIGALVTEVGGQLSHPAIVAREYGLPAVVGCEGAMTRFRDGQIVRVDGTAGTVTAIESDRTDERSRR